MPLLFTFSLGRFVFSGRRSLGLLLLGAALVAGGCGPRPELPLPVFGSPDSPRLRQVVAGLKTGLAPRPLEVVCVPEFGPAGEAALSRLRAQHPPLLLVLGSPALIRVAPVEKVIPVVFAMVANPYVTGAADNPEHPDIHQKNITGLASPPPVGPALEQGSRLLGPGAWGMLYDPSEGQAVEVAKLFTDQALKLGLTPLTETSTNASTDLPALKKLLSRGARVLYVPPTASAARYASLILAWGRERQVRVVSSQAEGDHKGAILWVALDYRTLGEEAGQLARRVLAGENPEKIPITEKMPLQVEADESLIQYWSGYPGVSRIPGVTPAR
jgi:putative tryptophan/tyrosine transport system substrate-binding protein